MEISNDPTTGNPNGYCPGDFIGESDHPWVRACRKELGGCGQPSLPLFASFCPTCGERFRQEVMCGLVLRSYCGCPPMPEELPPAALDATEGK